MPLKAPGPVGKASRCVESPIQVRQEYTIALDRRRGSASEYM